MMGVDTVPDQDPPQHELLPLEEIVTLDRPLEPVVLPDLHLLELDRPFQRGVMFRLTIVDRGHLTVVDSLHHQLSAMRGVPTRRRPASLPLDIHQRMIITVQLQESQLRENALDLRHADLATCHELLHQCHHTAPPAKFIRTECQPYLDLAHLHVRIHANPPMKRLQFLGSDLHHVVPALQSQQDLLHASTANARLHHLGDVNHHHQQEGKSAMVLHQPNGQTLP
ncbi:MAG: hypothetical protein Q9224_006832 [Gallowayella concinna]